MGTEVDRKQTSFRAGKALLHAFGRWLYDHNLEMSPVLEHWIDAFMAAPEQERHRYSTGTIPFDNHPYAGTPPVPTKDVELKLYGQPLYKIGPRSPQEQECRDGLQEIFDSGDPEVMDAIHRNVRQFVRLVRAARKEVARGKADPDAASKGTRADPARTVDKPMEVEKPLDRLETDAEAFQQEAEGFRKGMGKGRKRDTGTTGPRRKG